ncbi:unnamed protein product [Boreogadus saida]
MGERSPPGFVELEKDDEKRFFIRALGIASIGGPWKPLFGGRVGGWFGAINPLVPWRVFQWDQVSAVDGFWLLSRAPCCNVRQDVAVR